MKGNIMRFLLYLLIVGFCCFGNDAIADEQSDKIDSLAGKIADSMSLESREIYSRYIDVLTKHSRYDCKSDEIFVKLNMDAPVLEGERQNSTKNSWALTNEIAQEFVDSLNDETRAAYVDYLIEKHLDSNVILIHSDSNISKEDISILQSLFLHYIKAKQVDMIQKILLYLAPQTVFGRETPQALVVFGDKSYVEYIFQAYNNTKNETVKEKLAEMICNAFPSQGINIGDFDYEQRIAFLSQNENYIDDWVLAAWKWYKDNKDVLIINNSSPFMGSSNPVAPPLFKIAE